MHYAPASTEPSWKLPKGCWRPLETADGPSASLSCPGCGLVGTLDDHEIQGNGAVTPSVDCPASCGFHDYVVLEGWHGKNGVHRDDVASLIPPIVDH